MNGSNTHSAPQSLPSPRAPKPPPSGPAPPAPLVTPPAPPNHSSSATRPPLHSPTVNGTQKAKKKNDAPVDPAAMYESLKNRIAALEEEEVLEEEEERQFGLPIPFPSFPFLSSSRSRGGRQVRQRYGRERYPRQIH